jgi:hypothetical protein
MNAGAVFGHEELFAGINLRRTRVTADTHAIVAYMNKEDFDRPDL